MLAIDNGLKASRLSVLGLWQNGGPLPAAGAKNRTPGLTCIPSFNGLLLKEGSI